MAGISEFIVQPEIAFNDEAFLKFVDSQSYRLHSKLLPFKVLRRSIDARSRDVKVNLSIEFFEEGKMLPLLVYRKPAKINENAKRILKIGRAHV